MSVEDSFKPGVTQTGPKGQLAHPTTLEPVSYTHLTLPTNLCV